MESHGVINIKVLATSEPPVMRRIYSYVEPDMYDELVEIAEYEQLGVSAAIRELLGVALRYYKFKKGTLNPNTPQNSKTFYCQTCDQLTKIRNMHTAIVLNDICSFCEDCFFADKHKALLINVINKS